MLYVSSQKNTSLLQLTGNYCKKLAYPIKLLFSAMDHIHDKSMSIMQYTYYVYS